MSKLYLPNELVDLIDDEANKAIFVLNNGE